MVQRRSNEHYDSQKKSDVLTDSTDLTSTQSELTPETSMQQCNGIDQRQYSRLDLSEMISNYMTANMPTNAECEGGEPGALNENLSPSDSTDETSTTDRKIPKDSLEHASLVQKQFETPTETPLDFDFEFCTRQENIDLRNILKSVQLHDVYHRATCKKKGDFCRFHFPWPRREKTEIKYIKLKGMKKPQLRVLAERNDCWVNNYNGWTILHHRANMDLQFICDPQGTAMYCCLYSSKAEAPDINILSKKMLKLLATNEKVQCHYDIKKTLYLSALAVYSSREVSSQEATWYLLGYPFHFSSRPVINVNLLPLHRRHRILKSAKDLNDLPSDSTDVFEPKFDGLDNNLLAYMNIKNPTAHLSELSLYEFVVGFQETKTKKDYQMSPSYLKTSEGKDGLRFKRRQRRVVFNMVPYLPPDFNSNAGAWGILLAHHKHFNKAKFESWDYDAAVTILQRDFFSW